MTMTFDVKRCRTCAYTIIEILIAFIKKQNLRQNILSFIHFEVILMSSLNDINKKGSHDTPNLILSNSKQVNIQFCQCA